MLLASGQYKRLIDDLSESIGLLKSCAGGADEDDAQQRALLWSFALILDELREQRTVAPQLDKHLQGLTDLGLSEDELGALRTRFSGTVRGSELCRHLRHNTAESGSLYVLVHLFEHLLATRARRLRRTRGAFFTPLQLVQYIVRSTHVLLERDLNIPRGMMANSQPLCIVDPACGSGAFLLGVLSELFSAGNLSPDRITAWFSQHQLAGIDILPACSGAATLLVEQVITRWAGNSMASRPVWSAIEGNVLGDTELSRQLFTNHVPVIIGNPPYNNFGQQNRNTWILQQLDEYKRELGEKKLNLNDDFIKFIRWAQWWVDWAGRGVVAMVTNNTYLSGLTHRQMRSSLARSFDHIYVLDLHGSLKKREVTPAGTADQNVFSIQQGVAIGLFVKAGQKRQGTNVWHHELWGDRTEKLRFLADRDVTNTPWKPIQLRDPEYFFIPRPQNRVTEYEGWPRIDSVFRQYVSGVQTKRDRLFVAFRRDELEGKVRAFLAEANRGELGEEVPLWLKKRARSIQFESTKIRQYMVAPFDLRWVYYDPQLLGRARYRLLHCLDADNLGLVFMRQTTNTPPYDHFLVTNMLVSDRVFYSAHGAPFVAPLYCCSEAARVANFQPDYVQQLAQRLKVPCQSLAPQSILQWIYASLLDPGYRSRFQEQLCIDFPRVPWPRDIAHFRDICRAGKELIAAHLHGASTPELAATPGSGNQGSGNPGSGNPGSGNQSVKLGRGFPRWKSDQLILSDQVTWPDRVPEVVWNARIGGYRVLPRWFKQRQGRVLDDWDREHIRRMITALSMSGT